MDNPTSERLQWLKWAQELQSLAQCGLAYTTNPFDKERFEKIREIAAQMVSLNAEVPLEHVREVFSNEQGYKTPKLDTRAAIFKDNKILLVQEQTGRWAMPGGWVDHAESIRSNTVKEALEEAGLVVEAVRIIALHDRKQHNKPEYLHNICKVFVLCREISGCFQPNLETLNSGYFALDELPVLAEGKNNRDQIAMCFQAKDDPHWQVVFD